MKQRLRGTILEELLMNNKRTNKEQYELYYSVHLDFKPNGKVIILKDNERVVNKWSLWLMYVVVFFSALAGVLRIVNWVLS